MLDRMNARRPFVVPHIDNGLETQQRLTMPQRQLGDAGLENAKIHPTGDGHGDAVEGRRMAGMGIASFRMRIERRRHLEELRHETGIRRCGLDGDAAQATQFIHQPVGAGRIHQIELGDEYPVGQRQLSLRRFMPPQLSKTENGIDDSH